jgi:DNA-binding transcriptional regulator YdaS (Cro superfamily)
VSEPVVYFLRVGGDGPVKIGYSSLDPVQRMADLQVGCPWKLTFWGCIPGTSQNEAWLHEKFEAYKMQGEWFQPVPEVTEEIAAILANSFYAWPTKELTALDRAISFAGSQCNLSKAIGFSQPLLSRARKAGRVGPEVAIAIHHYTNGEIPASDLRPDLWAFPNQVPVRPQTNEVAS